MKVTYYFTETNKRLGESKNRSKTINVDVHSAFMVDEIVKKGKTTIKHLCQSDSEIKLKSYKVGVRTFEVNVKF